MPIPRIDALAAELDDDDAVLSAGSDLTAYERPWRGVPGTAAFVVRPRTIDETRIVVRWAVRHRVHLVTQGANTGLVGASVPDGTGTVGVLSTERLVATVEVDVDERAVTAAAGVRLSAVANAAGRHGLELPVDLAADASVGGIVATNAGGCRVLRHGDVRRRLLGLQVVLPDADASVVGDLRPLRKKNDQVRLVDLVVGSGGLFGIVTAASLELAHRPTVRATALVVPAQPRDLVAVCTTLERALGPRLGALELMSAAALDITVRHLETVTRPFPGPTPEVVLLVEVDGDEDVLVAALDGLGDRLADAAIVPVEDAWALRHGISEALAREGDVLGLDVSLPRAAIAGARDEAAAVVRRLLPDALLADFGHVGDGGLHLNVVLPPDRPPDAADRLRHAVYEMVERHGGCFSAEHGIGPANLDWWREHTPPSTMAALATVKKALDPQGLLGPHAVCAALGQF